MRFNGLKVKVIDASSSRHEQIGYIESYKWFQEDIYFAVRFHNRLETFLHNEIEITEESIENWKKYSGEE